MEQSRSKPFGRILARSATNRFPVASRRTNTDLSLLDLSADERGVLGLSTLYEPPSGAPFANIVFVHGLGGGSRKTWSYSPNIQHFWPLQWLPEDPDFGAVRILSFGYNANWGERGQSVLRVHDFAQSLLGELRNHPGIRRDTSRLVLVGHSMGGCVAKKTYILARQDPACETFVQRFHAMVFLGTPHRGSDLATTLERMLVSAWGKKPFVSDLTPNSAVLAEINDAFRHYAPDLRLWSFYETLPTESALMNKLIVDKSSATLGYPHEEIAALNADHRHLCKFEDRTDPNFKVLRNALHTALDSIQFPLVSPPAYANTEGAPLSGGETAQSELARIRTFLGAHDGPENDLARLQTLREPGSCAWLSDSTTFATWEARKGADLFWLTGRPAAGKSVLSSHIIDRPWPAGCYCSYFFFRHGQSGKSTLGDCLRSLIFQMASQDALFRTKLSSLEEDGTSWDKTDETNLWRKILLPIAFQLPTISRHVWVIDALDECANFQALFTKRLLATVPQGLRLFVTSRDLEEIRRGFSSMSDRVTIKSISNDDTVVDMQLLLRTKLRDLDRFESEESLEQMADDILAKSSGSFLWVRLVLQEFENAWTQEAMQTILNEIPAGLYDMYTRMVRTIEADPRKTALARCILTWVVLSSRPLTVEELRCAVRLDVQQTLQNMEKAIPSICGQLVTIDQRKTVHMIHDTAREFLVEDGLDSALAISKLRDHTRLAALTLQYLCDHNFRPQPTKAQPSLRLRGVSKAADPPVSDVSFLEYAARCFSDHIYRSTSEIDELMDHLCSFLGSANVLGWIEHLAKHNELAEVTRAATNLRGYLSRRTKYVPPTDPSIFLVDAWVTDFIRVAAKFQAQLLTCPSAIYHLIPPLCPSESIMAQTFAQPKHASLTVLGLKKGNWDDCLMRIDFPKGQTTRVSHGDSYFAVGLSTGQISLFNSGTFEQVHKMQHPERVRMLEFGLGDDILVSAGLKHIVVWKPRTGKQLQSFSLSSPLLAVHCLSSTEILGAFQSGKITNWDIETGESATVSWKEDDDLRISAGFEIPDQLPLQMAFVTMGDDVLLAVGYRSLPIIIWNVLDLRIQARGGADFCNGIDDMVFNPDPEHSALAVSYNDGSLCLFNCLTMEMSFRQPGTYAQSLACSPDGRSLLAGSTSGTIEVYEFDQDHAGRLVLTLIHRISAVDDAIRSLAFSYDGVHFVDVRGRQCRVWAPAALVRQDNELESTSDAVPLPAKTVGLLDASGVPEVASDLAIFQNGLWAAAGRNDGCVVVYSADDGAELGVLYRHARGVSVNKVILGEVHGLVVSIDDAGRLLIARIAEPIKSGVAITAPKATVVFERRLRAPFVDMLVDSAAERLFLTTRESQELWELPSGKVLHSSTGILPARNPDLPPVSNEPPLANHQGAQLAIHEVFMAINHPSDQTRFIVISGDTAHVLSWADMGLQTGQNGIKLEYPPDTAPASPHSPVQRTQGLGTEFSESRAGTVSYHAGPGFVVGHRHATPTSSSRLAVWPASAFEPDSQHIAQPIHMQHLDAIGSVILSVVGLSDRSLLFLDTSLWVCSTELEGSNNALERKTSSSGQVTQVKAQAHRHFFALSEWRTASGQLRCALGTAKRAVHRTVPSEGSRGRSVFFTASDRVIVAKGGLEFSEGVAMAGVSRKTQEVNQQSSDVERSAAHNPTWAVVSGSMHRRASNW